MNVVLVVLGAANLLAAIALLPRRPSGAPAGRKGAPAPPAGAPPSRKTMTPEETETARLEQELLRSFARFRHREDLAGPGKVGAGAGRRNPALGATGAVAHASQRRSMGVSPGGAR